MCSGNWKPNLIPATTRALRSLCSTEKAKAGDAVVQKTTDMHSKKREEKVRSGKKLSSHCGKRNTVVRVHVGGAEGKGDDILFSLLTSLTQLAIAQDLVI